MGIKVYVITHKATQIPEIEGYCPLLVGASINDIKGFKIKDNSGENISSKNSSYCELTGIYWIWKNTKSDIVGISHYRRFFSKQRYSISKKSLLKEKDIKRILSNKRIILPCKEIYATSVLQRTRRAPNIKDISEIYQAINNCDSNYIDDYLCFLGQNKASLYNMFIMKWQDFDAYCSWLFKILDYIESHHDLEAETDPYRKRLFGFLSERLLSVWVHHNISEKEIKYIPVVNVQETIMQRIRHTIANRTREVLYFLNRKKTGYIVKEKNMINTISHN